ncbi:hypothetical protein BDV23DRAFT_165206 [Aspergillus alliaceus]|uniref:Uncharacterized protein n=1 Tax=Petromyces alliaceus TaxID=209559 RepID=A0A5N7BTY8_PETAA|nr:hypothetical protein BDV23DRAFT_165206 [Aspergillus alliaceus]
MPAPTEVQSATLKKFLQGWETITAESWTGLWSDNCTQQFLPFSLGLPPKSREEVLQTLPKLLSVLRDWKLDIHHVVHDTILPIARLQSMRPLQQTRSLGISME